MNRLAARYLPRLAARYSPRYSPHFAARVAGPLAAMLLAIAVVAPTLASTAPPSRPGTSPIVAQAEVGPGAARCAADRLAARANPTVANLQALGYCEIDRRLATIDRLASAVDQGGVLTDDHAAALKTILRNSRTGLAELRGKIAGETTVAAVKEDIRHIFTDYRIYALVTRQVVLVRADDRVGAAVVRLNKAAGRVSDAIARAQSNGKDVTAAQGHLIAMKAAISAATDQVSGDAANVLAQTPATWNAGTAKPVLDAARASVSAAQADLRTAVADGKAALAALR